MEHPNIIWLHEIIDDAYKQDIYLVTEYHSKGSVGDLITYKNEKYDEHNKTCKEQCKQYKRVGLD